MAGLDSSARREASAPADPGFGTRQPTELLPIKIISLSFGTTSLIATMIASFFFLRMRRSFRHDLIVLLLLGDFIKGLCFIAYPIASLDIGLRQIPQGSLFCEINGYFLTVGTEASDVAVLLIALHTALCVLRPHKRSGDSGIYPYRYYAYAFFVLYPLINVSLAYLDGPPGMADSGEFCYLPVREAWYRSYLAWIPRYIIFGLIVALYLCLFFYVRYSQWRYEHEGSPSLPSSHPYLPSGIRRSLSRKPTHGLPPGTPLLMGSRRGSRDVDSRDRTPSQGSVWSVKPASPRRVTPWAPIATSLSTTMIPEEGGVDTQEKEAAAVAPRPGEPSTGEPSTQNTASAFTNWSWGEPRHHRGTPLSEPRTEGEPPVSPTSGQPLSTIKAFPPRPAVSAAPNADAPGTPQTPSEALPELPCPAFRRSSSQQSLIAALRAGLLQLHGPRSTGETTATGDESTTTISPTNINPSTSLSTPAQPPTTDTTTTTPEVAKMRSRIRTQLRLLALYPLLYIAMWLVPFVSHVLGFDDATKSSNPIWLGGLAMASLAVQGAVNSALFTGREKPWRHLDSRGFRGAVRERATEWWVETETAVAAGRRRESSSWGKESGRSRQRMVDDGRLARSRRANEVREERRRAGEKRFAAAAAAEEEVARFWWDVDIERADAMSGRREEDEVEQGLQKEGSHVESGGNDRSGTDPA